MNKNLLIALLAASTVGASAVAVHYARLQPPPTSARPARPAAFPGPESASASTDDAAADEVLALREQNRECEGTIQGLRDEIALLQAEPVKARTLPGQSATGAIPRPLLAEMLEKPETVALTMDWIKAEQHPRYAALMARQPHLTDAQREQLRQVLAERYAARMGLVSAAGGGAIPAGQRQQLEAEYHADLVALIGEPEAALFERIEILPVAADQLQRLDNRLRYEATPLDAEQYTALWSALTAGDSDYQSPADESALQALVQQRQKANAEILAQAQSLLQPDQYKVLEQLLHDDTATWQVQLAALVRARAAGSRP